MRLMCLLWAAALLMGLWIVGLMDADARPEPEPTSVVATEDESQ
jgi:hypothetical protein